jgi:signal peptidase
MEIKDFASIALYVLFGVFLALVINFGLALALGTDLPIVAVQSNSMVPTFHKGDLLVLVGVSPNQLQVGDIIVFSPKEGATPIVHRIIKINEDGTFQTKGDANTQQLPFEKSIKPEQIHGKSVLIIPYLGWIKITFVDLITLGGLIK